MMRTETDDNNRKDREQRCVFSAISTGYYLLVMVFLSPGNGTTLDVSHKGREGRDRREEHQPKKDLKH